MGLREIESTLPPGFRFYPSDQELVCHYLYKKVTNERASQGTLVEVDLHAREPWELPDVAKLTASEWYFFSFRDRKYATGSRTNRATKTGYWKATGKDREVRSPSTRAVVGMRKTLVFYQGRAPNGTKTSWVMHEFRLDSPHLPPRARPTTSTLHNTSSLLLFRFLTGLHAILQEDWVLCRVFQKQKVDGDQDNARSSSPTFAGSSQPAPELPVMDAGNDHMTGFAPPRQEEIMACGSNPLMNAAVWQQYNSLLLDQYPQEETTAGGSPALARGVTGDDCGFFFDSGFEDMAGLGQLGAMPMRFPQGQGWS
ncbi:protein CUP-SHAPED COTYLEDON 1-like [Hordeum vulgare]|nr:protein CUP-SHAPED COTYLEDON 1-like [Hordeum vulgare]KAE8803841.1 protein CUP-SHAPED COTYLEDON 1-like [Hordeum vulgare]